jgi:hypothetical protein
VLLLIPVSLLLTDHVQGCCGTCACRKLGFGFGNSQRLPIVSVIGHGVCSTVKVRSYCRVGHSPGYCSCSQPLSMSDKHGVKAPCSWEQTSPSSTLAPSPSQSARRYNPMAMIFSSCSHRSRFQLFFQISHNTNSHMLVDTGLVPVTVTAVQKPGLHTCLSNLSCLLCPTNHLNLTQHTCSVHA